jgi:Phosphotransferase enzyme family
LTDNVISVKSSAGLAPDGHPTCLTGPLAAQSLMGVSLATLGGAVKVPERLTELLSPEWLTAALGPRYPGIRVTDVTPGEVKTRISTNAFFRIECAAGLPPGLPADLCGKGYFSDTGNWAYRSAGESEAHFYRNLAPAIGVRTLPSVYADVDPATRHGVVITEDIAAAGATFVDPLRAHTPSEVAESLQQYVALHAKTWWAPDVGAVPWLAPRIASTLGVRSVPEIQDQFDGPIGAGVPKEARKAEELVAAYRALPEITEAAPSWCLLHGDAHVGNLFADAGGQPGLLDWQLVQRGPWYVDVGYHIASSLDVADRRTSERDLLSHYLGQLASQGVVVPGWDEVWLGYLCGIAYGLFLWSITQKVKPEITTVLLGRLGTAAHDHDVYRKVQAARL